MNIPVSGNAVAGRRLFLQNRHTLLDFSDPATAARAEIADGLDALSVCELQPGPVSRGTHALRLHAAAQTDGTACHRMSISIIISMAREISSESVKTLENSSPLPQFISSGTVLFFSK